MSKKIVFWIDPLTQLNPQKDTTLAFIQAANQCGHQTYVFTSLDVNYCQDDLIICTQRLEVNEENTEPYTRIGSPCNQPIEAFDAVFIRKDPPFDTQYLYICQLLMSFENCLSIFNRPSALCVLNEKTITRYFPDVTPKQIITSSWSCIQRFAEQNSKIVFKPLDGMGGKNIFITSKEDPNLKIIAENLTENFQKFIILQVYLADIEHGDKRILIIDGVPAKNVLVRKSQEKWGRGNLVRGAIPVVRPIENTEKQVCSKLCSFLKQHGLRFVGVDMIGEYITEINITSPTGVCEIQNQSKENIALEAMEKWV